jgi:putative chitinase
MRAYDVVKELAPHGRPDYLAAFDQGDALLQQFEVTTPARLAPLIATVLEETGDLTVAYEDMRYTHASRIAEVWPSRPEAQKYVDDPVNLANCVYGGRMGNGGFASGDGYRFRGTGLLQTTGREAFETYSREWGVDFVGHPELMLTPEHALKPLLSEWRDHGCNALADRQDFREITGRVNGGYTNWEERVRQLSRVKKVQGTNTLGFAPVKSVLATAATVAVARSVLPHLSLDPAMLLKIVPLAAVAAAIGLVALIAWRKSHEH